MGIKYPVDRDFFKQWNAPMAYALGFIYADGSIHRSSRGHYLSITSIDQQTVVNFKRWFRSGHAIVKAKPTWPNGKFRFVLRIGDKEIFNDLLKLGLYPNKSLTVRIPEIPRSFVSDFIRGYFDGDGCVYLYRSSGKGQPLILRQLSAIFTSGSRLFLVDLLNLLKQRIIIRQTRVYDSHRSFQLCFKTADAVELFKFMYASARPGLFLLRKHETFQNYFRLRPQRVDKEVKAALRYSSEGHVAK